jgi:methionine-rich copper-binding protein CopC
MKTIFAFAFFLITWLEMIAQNGSPIARIEQQLTSYYNFYPAERVFLTTDKQCYKPGEIIWFSAEVVNSRMEAAVKQELIVRVYNKMGEQVMGDKYELNQQKTSGDIELPENLPRGNYFLVAFTSTLTNAEEAFCALLKIDPAYSDEWVAATTVKDSISVAGQKNELTVLLRDFSGDIQKNTSLRYQLENGKDIIENGKIKSDQSGKAIIPFILPSKSNGDPFICELSDSKTGWKKEVFLASNIDPIVIRFYPEGGTIIAGTVSKIGFSAFNKCGMPVDIEGLVLDENGKQLAIVKTFAKGFGLFAVANDGSQKLKLALSGKTGQNQTFDLPAPQPSGLAFSVVKNDPDFIWVNLVFADKQKHSVALTATNGSNMHWAADIDINGLGRTKIPKENLPQGINLLSVFSQDGTELASRAVYIDKKQTLKIEVKPETNTLKPGESMKVKIRLTDENNQPVSGSVCVSVADSFRKNGTSPKFEEYMLTRSELETPFCLIPGAFNGQVTSPQVMDLFLIANRFKGFDWQKIMQFKPEKVSDNKSFEDQLTDYLSRTIMKNSLLGSDLAAGEIYFSNNPGLFERGPKISKPNTVAIDSQKKLLSVSTSLLEVIKVIKPYRIMNNQIVFMGSENSFNAQGGALIVLDGQQMGTDVSNLSIIPPLDVDHINISTNPMDIQRYTGLNSVGIIEIFSKKGEMLPTPEKEKTTNRYNGEYRIPNVFPTDLPNPKRDFRTTLQWIPELKVDETGQAEILVTAGKVLSDFIIEIRGISGDDRAGSGSTKFSVAK